MICVRGPAHPDTLLSRSELAIAYRAAGASIAPAAGAGFDRGVVPVQNAAATHPPTAKYMFGAIVRRHLPCLPAGTTAWSKGHAAAADIGQLRCRRPSACRCGGHRQRLRAVPYDVPLRESSPDESYGTTSPQAMAVTCGVPVRSSSYGQCRPVELLQMWPQRPGVGVTPTPGSAHPNRSRRSPWAVPAGAVLVPGAGRLFSRSISSVRCGVCDR